MTSGIEGASAGPPLIVSPDKARIRRRRQHRLPAGRVAAREVAAAVGVPVRTLLRRIVPTDNAATLDRWVALLGIQAVPSRGHFMFTFDAERVRAHAAELRETCGGSALPIGEARLRSAEREDRWGEQRRRHSSPSAQSAQRAGERD
jgi:hypothetical protein